MGSEVCADELMNEDNPSENPTSISKLQNEISCDIIESKNITLRSQPPKPVINYGPSIGPITPDSKRENAEQKHDLLSPLTVLPSPPHAPCSYSLCDYPNSSYGNGLETPKETLFDSFDPGPDKFMLAPQHQKYKEESRNHVVRRLNFTCATNLACEFSGESAVEARSDEERLFDIVYGTILDAIFSEQSEELKLSTELPSHSSDLEGPRTPKSARIFNGVAETCPGAPMKASSKSRNIDKEIRRKLEF